MKKIALFILLAVTAFADQITLNNQTVYPSNQQKAKIAVQWANSAKEVDEANNALIYGTKLKTGSLKVLTQSGTIQLTIPARAEHFRILVWTKGYGDPDLVTNWVDITPGKTYTLETDHLVPAVLMSGSGC